MTDIAASDLTVTRGGHAILKGVSLRAQSRELVGVIGANGAGKSTLLAALAGLLAPDTGNIRLNGHPLSAHTRTATARLRAYLPQNPRCEWPISVERLVALGLTPVLPAFGGLPSHMQARVEQVLVEWDLVAHRQQPATTLSGGELARAMLARALVGDPEILIADEPILGLDARHALDTLKRLRGLAQSGKLILIALHDLTLAVRYATRLVALDRGRIVADGPPGEILTAGLLRSVFDVEAYVAESNGGPYVDYIAPLHAGAASTGGHIGAEG
jgi:iron complex transport system ATP-binding protein